VVWFDSKFRRGDFILFQSVFPCLSEREGGRAVPFAVRVSVGL